MEYYREEETGRLIQEWLRWAGDGLNTPQSKLGKEYQEGDEYWKGIPVVATQAEFTDSTMKSLPGIDRRALILYHWRGKSQRKIALELKRHHSTVPTILAVAHDHFWTLFESHRKKADTRRKAYASGGL